MARTENCDFLGHLANDMSACVAVTGCIGSEDVDITIMGDRGGSFQIDLNGNVSRVELPHPGPVAEDRKKKKKFDDGLDDPEDPVEEEGEQAEFEYCKHIDCPDLPPTGVLDIQVNKNVRY